MRLLGFLLLSVLVSSLAMGKDQLQANRTDTVQVASLMNEDHISVINVLSVLRSNGINAYVDRRRMAMIFVPIEQSSDACKLLNADCQKNKYQIQIYEDGKLTSFEVPREVWSEFNGNLHFSRFAERVNDEPLKTASELMFNCREFKEQSKTFPFIERMQVRKRTFLNADDFEVGFEVIVDLAVTKDLNIGRNSLKFQIWNKGKNIKYKKNTESWFGSKKVVSENRIKYENRVDEQESVLKLLNVRDNNK